MLYGDIRKESIDLSESTCWSGEPGDGGPAPDAPQHFRMARECALRGDYEGMKRHLERFVGSRQNYGTNLPLGHLTVEYPETPAEASSYGRSLRLAEGLAEVSLAGTDNALHLTSFVSHPHQVLVLRISSASPSPAGLLIGLDGAANPFTVHAGSDGDLILEGRARECTHSDGATGVSFYGRMRVTAPGGTVQADGEKLRIRQAPEVYVYLAVHTDYNGACPEDLCGAELNRAAAEEYPAVLRAHRHDFRALMDRVHFSLGTEKAEERPTDERLERVRRGEPDPQLTALLFQYGRYLLISSSRADSPLPAHLQGVWNDNVACRIGWTCDMHLDINTQMNYWPAEVTGLPECHLPLLRWVENDLVPSGRRTAQNYYGLEGWAAELVSNAWGYTAPYWHTNLSPCPAAGVWTATHLWEHYLFTQDIPYLREHVYPVLEQAVRFFLGYVFADPETGKIASGPSVSPENLFQADGRPYAASLSPAYEIAMIRELMDIFIRASRLLNQTGDLVNRAENVREHLPEFQVGRNGELKEWSHEFAAADPHHRHTSHLLALYPLGQISPRSTPVYARAAKRSVRLRTTPEDTWEDTGWSRAMLLLYAARLLDPVSAYLHIQSAVRRLANANLMIHHPPTRGAPSFANVYELDGNTGLTAGIAEMLLQSHGGEIHLLPALPEEWADGYIRGLRARGGYRIDIRWECGKLAEATLYSSAASTCRLRYGGRVREFPTQAGGVYPINHQLQIIT